jgi:hypothetical protein
MTVPALATLTEEEKARIRHHFGVPQTYPISDIQLGVPAAAQPMFILERQMNVIPNSAIAIIREDVAKCDTTEAELFQAQRRLKAKSVDSVDLNPDECDQRRAEYRYWVTKLGDDLGAPINAFSAAFRTGGGMPLNIPVMQ